MIKIYCGVIFLNVSDMKVSQISELLSTKDELPIDIITTLRNDSRRSVVNLLNQWQHRQITVQQDRERVEKLYHYEKLLNEQGFQSIAGVDEAGRGPLAGPVVIAAVILPLACYLPCLNDSKKLSAKQREELYKHIKDKAIAVSSCIVDVGQIDEMNIYQATVYGMYQAIEHLSKLPDHVLIDAVPLPKLKMPFLSMTHGDAKSASIAAASIIAKVERDHIMNEQDKKFPLYGFARHKGYGTQEHITALQNYGYCAIHRKSFEPIKSMGKNGYEY